MGIEQSIYSTSTLVIALLCVHAPRGRYRAPLFCLRFHVSVAEPNFLMAEAPVPIPPDVLVAALPAAEAAAVAEVPAAGDNPVAPAEEVSWFLSLYCGCFLLPSGSSFEMCGVCCLCFHGVCRLASLFSWRVSPFKFVFMAYVAFNLVYGVCRRLN